MFNITAEDVANFVAMASGAPVILFTLIYGILVRWYRTLLGTSVFSLFLSFALLFSMIILRRTVGEFPAYDYIAISVYSFMLLSFSFFLWVFLLERKRGKDSLAVPIAGRTGEVKTIKESR